MKQVFNPYLPLKEYVPDGEPHVFDGRVYIYGSHDEARGSVYCPGHYVTWSAPVEDLKDWRYEGIIYRRNQDPSNAEDKMQLWAPDVTKGPDGRYYIYYCFSFYPEIGIGVSDSPAGPFAFYGHVQYADGQTLRDFLPFDPGVLTDDDGRVYLYYGFAPENSNPDYPIVPSPGSMAAELEPDMKTIKSGPRMCVPGAANARGTSFEGHAFYEASSIRKFNGTYYFIYSSELSHELCYATSKYPDRDFVYGGILVSNGDVGLNGRKDPVNMTGNNHGSIEKIGDDYYIFYHRQTHATESSRQGCAEKLEIRPDGSFAQAEITSCGLNGGPLKGQGGYSAAIACHLTCKEDTSIIVYGQDRKAVLPYIYETENGEHMICNVHDGTVFGFKYFNFEGVDTVSVVLRGCAKGVLTVKRNPKDAVLGSSAVQADTEEWISLSVGVSPLQGTMPLYFSYEGEGRIEVKEIVFG